MSTEYRVVGEWGAWGLGEQDSDRTSLAEMVTAASCSVAAHINMNIYANRTILRQPRRISSVSSRRLTKLRLPRIYTWYKNVFYYLYLSHACTYTYI